MYFCCVSILYVSPLSLFGNDYVLPKMVSSLSKDSFNFQVSIKMEVLNFFLTFDPF